MNRLDLLLLLPVLVLVSLVCTALSVPARAADAPPAQRSQPNEEVPTEAAAPSPPDRPLSGSEQRRAGDTGGIFRPSEDISEDLAVAFPVDI